jgi:hypothetical protein
MDKSAYVISYSALLKELGIQTRLHDEHTIELTGDQLRSLIKKLLVYISVDERWYRSTYSDIDRAIRSGEVPSAKEHFVSDGYFEDRLPSQVLVDEEFYTRRYPDVAQRIDDGEISSAQEHFESHGFSEGRLPFEI